MHQQSIYSCLLLFFLPSSKFCCACPCIFAFVHWLPWVCTEHMDIFWSVLPWVSVTSVTFVSVRICVCVNVSIALSFSCHCEVVLHHDHVSMLSSCTTSGNRPVWSVCWVACSCVCVTQNDICLATGDESWSDCLVPHRFLVTCLASYPDMFASSTWVDSALVTSF